MKLLILILLLPVLTHGQIDAETPNDTPSVWIKKVEAQSYLDGGGAAHSTKEQCEEDVPASCVEFDPTVNNIKDYSWDGLDYNFEQAKQTTRLADEASKEADREAKELDKKNKQDALKTICLTPKAGFEQAICDYLGF